MVRTDFRTGMKLETSLKLLQPTTWACTMRPCSELPASTHRAISWSPASTGGESCGGIGPELVSPTPPLPWKHGGEKQGLRSGVLEPCPGNMSIFCREPRVMKLMGRDTTCRLAMGKGGKAGADEHHWVYLLSPHRSCHTDILDVAQLHLASVLFSAGREMDSNSSP